MLQDGSSEDEEDTVDNESSDSGEDDDASNDSDTSDDDDDTASGGDDSGSEDDDDEKEASEKKPSGSPRLANRFRELTGNLKAKDEENATLKQQLEKMQSDMETLKRGGKPEVEDEDEDDMSELTSDPKELVRIQEFIKLSKKAKKLSKSKDATPGQIKAIMDEITNLKKASETFQKQNEQQADQAALKKVISDYADVIDPDELEARVYNQIYEWEHSADPREKVLAQAPWKKIVKLVLDEDELDEKEAAKIKAKKKKTAKKIDTEKDSEEKPAPSGEKRFRWNPGDPIGSREAMLHRMRERARASEENE